MHPLDPFRFRVREQSGAPGSRIPGSGRYPIQRSRLSTPRRPASVGTAVMTERNSRKPLVPRSMTLCRVGHPKATVAVVCQSEGGTQPPKADPNVFGP